VFSKFLESLGKEDLNLQAPVGKKLRPRHRLEEGTFYSLQSEDWQESSASGRLFTLNESSQWPFHVVKVTKMTKETLREENRCQQRQTMRAEAKD
jgi:hypothetical protein